MTAVESLSFEYNGSPKLTLAPDTYLSATFNATKVISLKGGDSTKTDYTASVYLSFSDKLDTEHASTADFRKHLNYFYTIVEDTYAEAQLTGGCQREMRKPRLKSGNQVWRMPCDGGEEENMKLITFDSFDEASGVLKGSLKDGAKADWGEIEVLVSFELQLPPKDSGKSRWKKWKVFLSILLGSLCQKHPR